LPALDPGGDIGHVAGLTLRRFLLQPLMWTVAVIVPDVLGQDAIRLHGQFHLKHKDTVALAVILTGGHEETQIRQEGSLTGGRIIARPPEAQHGNR
jgi:hypothetical protein